MTRTLWTESSLQSFNLFLDIEYSLDDCEYLSLKNHFLWFLISFLWTDRMPNVLVKVMYQVTRLLNLLNFLEIKRNSGSGSFITSFPMKLLCDVLN